MTNKDQEALTIFRRQGGTMSRQQALALNFTPRQISLRLQRGEWIAIRRGFYRHAAFPESDRMYLFALTLSGHGHLSHRYAAKLHGLEPDLSKGIELTVKPNSSVSRRGFTVHESTQLATAGLVDIDGLPMSGVERSIMDTAAVTPEAWKVLALIDSARIKDLTTAEALRDCLMEHAKRGRDGTVRFRAALEVVRYESSVPIGHLSRRVGALLNSSGLPYPRFEERILDESGRFVAQVDGSFDVGYVQFYDGFSTHAAKRRQSNRDRWQRQELRRLGYVVGEFTFDQIVKEPGYVIATSRREYSEASRRRRKAA